MVMLSDRRGFLSGGAGLAVASLDHGGGRAPGPAGASVRVTDFGTIGDGAFHPLSDRFATLAEARAVFPWATSLAESLDGAAIQAAIDQANRQGRRIQSGGHVLIPAGRYPLSRSLTLPGTVVLEGEGPGVTIIDNQNTPLAAPLIVNQDAGTARLTVRRMSLHGGTHGIRLQVADSVDGVAVEAVSFELQTEKNFECNKLLQIATFRDCRFGTAPFGVYVAGWTSNVVSFEQCSFENHARTHLHLRGAECVNISGGRFEGGGSPEDDRVTLDLEAAAAVNIAGVYFENTHRTLLRERESRDGVRFDGCHFSGATGTTGLVPYRFDSDGIVGFGSNDWGLVTQAPIKATVSGTNAKLAIDGRLYLVRSATHHHIRSESIVMDRGVARDMLTVRRRGGGSAATLAGTLVLELRMRERDGLPRVMTYRYGMAAAVVEGRVVIRPDTAAANAPPLRIRTADGLAAVSLAIGPGMPGDLRWTFEGTVAGGDPDASLDVDLD